MAELFEKTKLALHLENDEQIIAFMDSQIVIAQLQVIDADITLKSFVADRVKFVQERMNTQKIYYINRKENPSVTITK